MEVGFATALSSEVCAYLSLLQSTYISKYCTFVSIPVTAALPPEAASQARDVTYMNTVKNLTGIHVTRAH